MQFERFNNVNHIVLAWFVHLHHLGFQLDQLSPIWRSICGGNCVMRQQCAHPQQLKEFKHLIFVWYGYGMLCERFYILNHSLLAWFTHLHCLRFHHNYPKSNKTYLMGIVWWCSFMPIHKSWRCANTLYMYEMDVRCNLKGFITSTILGWHGLHTYIA